MGKKKTVPWGRKASTEADRWVAVFTERRKAQNRRTLVLSCTIPQEATHFCARGRVPGRENMELGWETTLVDHSASPPGCSDLHLDHHHPTALGLVL